MSSSNLKSFRWKGKNQMGQRLKGRMTAESSIALASILKQQGIISFRIHRVYSILYCLQQSTQFFQINKKARRIEIAFMLRQLSMLLSAHVSLIHAFEVMGSYHQNVSVILKKILQDCRIYLQSGHTLSKAFARHPQYFTAFFCRWIEAGEYSGTLDVLLEHWVTYQEKNEQVRQKIKKALTYPLFIMSTAVIVAMILLIGVMPIFEKLFHQMGAELPLLTQYVIRFAYLLHCFGLPLLFFLGVSVVIVWRIRERLPSWMFFLDKIILNIPFSGKIIREISMARFSRTLSILLSAGFPLSEALHWVAKVMNNRFLSQTILKFQLAVVAGTALSQIMSISPYFSSLLKQMIAIGEASGTLDKTLLHSADFYEKKVSHELDKITNLIEPVIMLILGTMAGIFILAMYLPIFKLGALF